MNTAAETRSQDHGDDLLRRAEALAALVDAADDAIVGRDLHGRVTSWNRAAERLFGASERQMLGATLDALVPAAQRAEEAELLRRLARGERVGHFESERLAHDGTLHALSLSLAPVFDAGGRVVGSSLIARDIGQRRRNEQAMLKRVRQLDVLSRAGQALIMSEQADGGLQAELFEHVRASIGAEIQLLYRADDAAGGLHLTSSHGLSPQAVAQLASASMDDSLSGWAARRKTHLVINDLHGSDMPAARALQDAGARCYAGFALRARDTVYGVAAFASTRRDSFNDGDLQMVRTVCDQVSAMLERRRLIDELLQSKQALERADHAKDDTIATLAHELRNPLAPIRNALGLLRDGDGIDRKQLAWCHGIIERQVAQMTHLLEDLVDASRLMRNRLELRSRRVGLQTVLIQAVESAQPLLAAQGHQLHVRLPDTAVALEGDPTRLTQVFTHLLHNAARYTPRGGQIELVAQPDPDDRVRVVVRDNGIGISAEQMPRVFEMFGHGVSANDRVGGGLGTGLALARGIVQLHGGQMTARSDGPGLGSEFVVLLPTALPLPSHADDEALATPDAVPPRRMLVVDDNVDAAQTLSALLELYGQEVRTAYDGTEALRIAREWPFDAAVLDLGMPGIDGYELCRRLREHSGAQRPLLIACTGWGLEEDRRRAQEAGFDAHVVKPVDAELLVRLATRQQPREGP